MAGGTHGVLARQQTASGNERRERWKLKSRLGLVTQSGPDDAWSSGAPCCSAPVPRVAGKPPPREQILCLLRTIAYLSGGRRRLVSCRCRAYEAAAAPRSNPVARTAPRDRAWRPKPETRHSGDRRRRRARGCAAGSTDGSPTPAPGLVGSRPPRPARALPPIGADVGRALVRQPGPLSRQHQQRRLVDAKSRLCSRPSRPCCPGTARHARGATAGSSKVATCSSSPPWYAISERASKAELAGR
jgi:hypothetical protein